MQPPSHRPSQWLRTASLAVAYALEYMPVRKGYARSLAAEIWWLSELAPSRRKARSARA